MADVEALYRKVAWAIYTASPEVVFLIWTAIVVQVTAGITALAFLLSRRVAFNKMAGTWATDELKASQAENKALTALVEELEADNMNHANVWTSLLATLSKTKGRKKNIIALEKPPERTGNVW